MIRYLIVFLFMSLAVQATAATVNLVRFGTGGLGASICAPVGSGTEITSSATVLQEFKSSSVSGHCQQSSVARAGGGSVGVRASMQADPGAGAPRVDLTARSEFDLMLGLPAAWAGGLIPISLAAQLEADLAATILTSSVFGRGASARLRATVELGGFSSVGGLARAETADVEDYRADATSPRGTPFGNLTILETLATNTIMIDPARAIRVAFELNGTVGGQVFNDSALTSDVLALNSLGFMSGVPIFDLPAGFTLNAPEFGIVDNHFVGTDPPPAPIPLPAAGVLLLGSLAVLSAVRGRRFRTWARVFDWGEGTRRTTF